MGSSARAAEYVWGMDPRIDSRDNINPSVAGAKDTGNPSEPFVIHESETPRESWDGIVSWHTLLSSDRTPTEGLTLGIAIIEPGASVDGAIHHHSPHEAYYVIEGTGRVHLDGAERFLEPGSAVFIPGGTHHFVINDGPGPLRLLYTFAINSFEDVEYHFPDRA